MEHVDVAVIGAGQAGLAMGYYLARQRRSFVILDGAPALGDAWRRRWDSLRLFTPACYDGLPGLPFPAAPEYLPGKDEVADYMAAYAAHWNLPVRTDTRVHAVRRPSAGDAFELRTSRGLFTADAVILATGPFHRPRIPRFAGDLGRDVVQFHSSDYRNPAQLPASGDVLVVGGGNSGVQIASELAHRRRTWLSVGSPLKRLPQRVLGRSLFWWLERTGLMDVRADSRLGRRMRTREFLIGDATADVVRRDGVLLTGRALAAHGRTLCTADRTLDVNAVIWATGYSVDFGILEPAWLDDDGRLLHRRGVTTTPGLYVLGLPWMHTRGSALLGWVHRDAQFIATHIARTPTTPAPSRSAGPRSSSSPAATAPPA